jgi:hypothetical protein
MIERQPRPLVTLPVALALTVICAIVLVVAGVGAVGVTADGTLAECTAHNTKSKTTSLDFTFFPMGYDCVFVDSWGKEVGRVRAGNWEDK